MLSNLQKKIALTIDVEDGINIAMRDLFNIQMPPTERVLKNMEALLSLVEKHQVKGTFFILGEVAVNYPGLVKEVVSRGHEVGIHGHSHTQYFKLTPAELEKEIRQAKDTIENITGQEVMGHRAPAFSVLPNTAWVLPILANAGLKYDSSIVPAKTGRYGWSGFPKEIVELELPEGGSLIEAPLSVITLAGKTIPAGGGGYFRHLPLAWTRHAFNRILRYRNAMLYLHPYEIDTEDYPAFFFEAAARANLAKQLRVKTFKLNKHKVLRKLDHLLQLYQFVPLGTIINELNPSSLKRVPINPVKTTK